MTEINALLYFQMMDPVKAMYEIENRRWPSRSSPRPRLRNASVNWTWTRPHQPRYHQYEASPILDEASLTVG